MCDWERSSIPQCEKHRCPPPLRRMPVSQLPPVQKGNCRMHSGSLWPSSQTGAPLSSVAELRNAHACMSLQLLAVTQQRRSRAWGLGRHLWVSPAGHPILFSYLLFAGLIASYLGCQMKSLLKWTSSVVLPVPSSQKHTAHILGVGGLLLGVKSGTCSFLLDSTL